MVIFFKALKKYCFIYLFFKKPQIHILEERNLVDGHYHVGLLKRCCIIKVEEIYLWKCIPIAKVVVFNSKVYDGKLGVNPNDPKYAEIKDFFVQEVMPYPHHLVPANQKVKTHAINI